MCIHELLKGVYFLRDRAENAFETRETKSHTLTMSDDAIECLNTLGEEILQLDDRIRVVKDLSDATAKVPSGVFSTSELTQLQQHLTSLVNTRSTKIRTFRHKMDLFETKIKAITHKLELRSRVINEVHQIGKLEEHSDIMSIFASEHHTLSKELHKSKLELQTP